MKKTFLKNHSLLDLIDFRQELTAGGAVLSTRLTQEGEGGAGVEESWSDEVRGHGKVVG